MSLKVVIDEVRHIKDALAGQTSSGAPTWEPSQKNDFAMIDDSAFALGVSPSNAEPAPQADPAAPGAAPASEPNP